MNGRIALLFLVVLVGLAVPPAAAEGRPAAEAISNAGVTPSDHLADRDVVAVSWSGATAHDGPPFPVVRIGVCRADATTLQQCDVEGQGMDGDTPIGAISAQTASGSVSMEIVDDPFTGDGPVDCNTTPCAVGFTDQLGSTPGLDQLVPISFDAVTVQPDALIASARPGPFKGNGVYATTILASQTKAVAVGNAGHTFYVRGQNDGTATAELRFKGVPSGGCTAQYLLPNGPQDITVVVRHGTYSRSLAPGTFAAIRVKIIPPGPGHHWTACNVDVTVSVSTDPTAKDKVRARITH